MTNYNVFLEINLLKNFQTCTTTGTILIITRTKNSSFYFMVEKWSNTLKQNNLTTTKIIIKQINIHNKL